MIERSEACKYLHYLRKDTNSGKIMKWLELSEISHRPASGASPYLRHLFANAGII